MLGFFYILCPRADLGDLKSTSQVDSHWESTWEVDLRSTWGFQVGSSHSCLPSSRFCLAPFVSCEVYFTTKNMCHVPDV